MPRLCRPFGLRAQLALCCAIATGGLAFAPPAVAQSEAQLQSIEQQIRALQNQLNQVKASLAARDRELKTAQDQAKSAQDQARSAQDRAAAASAQAAQIAAAPQVAAALAEPAQPPLPQGSFRVGKLIVTLGGFAAAEGIYRSRNESSSIDSSFGGIPLPNSPAFHTPE